MSVKIGSARHDENGKLVNGKAGDQTGQEVSEQAFYVHSKGWVILRAKNAAYRTKLAERMKAACNNPHIGYDQNQRTSLAKYGINTTVNCECDCSALVRQCIKEATGVDIGNFTTGTEKTTLTKSGLFDAITYTKQADLVTGDILVTKTKGHTVIVTEGNVSTVSKYYPKYTGSGTSLVGALTSVGEKDTTFNHRKKIAVANGIANYSGTAAQNITLVNLLKAGKCIKA